MTIAPSLRDVLWEAVLGGRGQLLLAFWVGFPMLLLGYITGSRWIISSALFYGLFLPVFTAGLIGTLAVAIWRTRERWPILSSVGLTVFGGAVLWNCGLLALASATEQMLTRAGVLDGPPRELIEAIIGPFLVGGVMSLLVAVPVKR